MKERNGFGERFAILSNAVRFAKFSFDAGVQKIHLTHIVYYETNLLFCKVA